MRQPEGELEEPVDREEVAAVGVAEDIIPGEPPLAPHALDRLMRYDWPGNVRELENVIERAMIVADGSLLDIDANWLTSVVIARPSAPLTALRDHEKQTILDALAQCNGKIYGADGAAARLGLKPTTLYGKMRKLGISKPGDEK